MQAVRTAMQATRELFFASAHLTNAAQNLAVRPSHASVQLRTYWGSPAILLSKRPELEAQQIGLLQGLRKVAIDELAKVEGDLQREAKEDAELKERHGSAWRRPSSAALNAKFMEKVAGA